MTVNDQSLNLFGSSAAMSQVCKKSLVNEDVFKKKDRQKRSRSSHRGEVK
jgi:hypothetical protein